MCLLIKTFFHSPTKQQTALAICAVQARIVSYAWTAGPWSDYTVTCGDATQTRTVACYLQGTVTEASEDKCVPSAKPKTIRVVTLDVCPKWQAGAWSEPSVTCGPFIATRFVGCYAGVTLVKDSKCAGEKPKTEKTFKLVDCPVYKWYSSEWSTPSVTCGPATVYRDVVCKDKATGYVVETSYCQDKKPNTEKVIALPDCPTYSWYTGEWSDPAASCGSTSHTREVYCIQDGGNGDAVDDSYCSGEKPYTIEAVELAACIYYEWYAGEWSEPSATCGPATETRDVTCVIIGGDYTAQDESFCTEEKPETIQYIEQEQCPVYQWYAGEWSTPSASCGDVTQYRTVSCQQIAPGPVTVVEDTYCPDETKPETSQVVSLVACPVFKWYTGAWADPSVTCGTATVVRTVYCKLVGSGQVRDSYCDPTPKPITAKTISLGDCPTYSWKTSAYSTPSVTCGKYTVTRSVWCAQDQTGTSVADAYCDPTTKPKSQKTSQVTCTI